jgi:ABC-type uncharacterized transport system substrate-binding protein
MKSRFVKSLLIGLYALGWAVAALPIASAADAPKIGILYPGPKGPVPSIKALGDLGYKDGQSVTLDIRYAEGKFDQLPALAKDLVAQNPNIIVAVSGEALFATAQATTTIPIVSATGGSDSSRIIPSNQSRGQSGSKPVQLHYTPNRREKDTPDNLQN